MPQYLITLSIGPVQDFIAAARRTRDLWMGSYLLSEISKAAAKSLSDQQAELIFPATDNPEKVLEPCTSPENCFNVGNKILARIETQSPELVVKKAEKAAQACWKKIAKQAREKAEKKEVTIDADVWDKQIGDVLEIYAAWVKFDPQSDLYKNKRKRLDQLLNARKNTRDFLPNLVDGAGIPKSSLDGLRENLIDTSKVKTEWDLYKLGIKKNEYLDVTGVAKRVGGDPEQFTPLSRLAVDPWLRGIEGLADIEPINSKLENLRKDFGLCTKVSVDAFDQLPYDGQLLYQFRIDAEINKISNTSSKEKDKNKVIELLEELKKAIEPLQKQYGEPLPYMAILHADGDNMGKLLDAMSTLDEHRNISSTLSSFSQQVTDIVGKYHGHCVYAGGDDVLALLPLDQAIACSRELADTFFQTMEQVTPDGIKTPTLSVGLGISHFMTPMPKQLDLARKAEKLAKEGDKNALAVILSPRSGAEISFREGWKNDADKVLYKWIEAHLEEEVPRQAAYNLRDESIALDWAEKPDNYATLINAETQRILAKKRTNDEEGKQQVLKQEWIDTICERAKQNGLRKTADELIMTYRIAQAYKQADRKTQENSNV